MTRKFVKRFHILVQAKLCHKPRLLSSICSNPSVIRFQERRALLWESSWNSDSTNWKDVAIINVLVTVGEMPVMLKRSAYNGCGQSLFSFLFLPQQRGPLTWRGNKVRPPQWSHCTCSGSTYNKLDTIQRRLAWPLRKDDTQIREAFPYFGPS